ncbi:hypothetical protein EVAR_41593_1 [Eumeta japonica]|uniref:Uncharacterized protein n=1 Tax=Eumeta variegata TaxID=151549 RepID=A0A4C1Y7B3_EUMVA|nr:hypothetical protein EVAR_41593_1 [Eumeta japonica]
MMQIFAGGDSNTVDGIVTSEESWIYCYDPEIKRQSTQSVFSFEELSTKVKPGQSVEKRKTLNLRFTDVEKQCMKYERAYAYATAVEKTQVLVGEVFLSVTPSDAEMC